MKVHNTLNTILDNQIQSVGKTRYVFPRCESHCCHISRIVTNNHYDFIFNAPLTSNSLHLLS
jgi:hypothetical protein